MSAPFRSLFSRPIGSRAQLVHAGAFRLFAAGVAACARTTIRRALLEGIGAALGVRPDDRIVGAMLLRLRFGSEDDQYFGRVPASRAREGESYHEQPQSEAMRRYLAWYHIGHGYFRVTMNPLPSRERASIGLFRDLATITSHAQDRARTCFTAGSPGSAGR